jgi:hypothetical protein
VDLWFFCVPAGRCYYSSFQILSILLFTSHSVEIIIHRNILCHPLDYNLIFATTEKWRWTSLSLFYFWCCQQNIMLSARLVYLQAHHWDAVAQLIWLDNRGVSRSSSPGRVKNFHFSISSRLALGSTQPPIQYGSALHGVKAARAWNWPLNSNQCLCQENMDLYIYSPIHLHGVVLN